MEKNVNWKHLILIAFIPSFLSAYSILRIENNKTDKENNATKEYVDKELLPVNQKIDAINEVNKNEHDRIQKELDGKPSNPEFQIMLGIVQENNRILKDLPKGG